MLNDFAQTLGWHPTDRFEAYELEGVTNAHLLVEHGLEHTAVISFFRYPRRYSDLNIAERQRLLAISYNNLVDWHIQIQSDEVLYVFNRADPPKIVANFRISERDSDKLRSEAFEQVTGSRPNPNIPALDDALIRTISFWKRNLAVELQGVSNEELSALFNTIIFIRAAEDNALRRLDYRQNNRLSLKRWIENSSANDSFIAILATALKQHVSGRMPTYVFDEARLETFKRADFKTLRALVFDFYQNKYAPYEYDFSLMSKHALSRIYEHYVSVLRTEPSEQLQFLPELPEEKKERAFGSIYTPQFVARFFARYLREQMPPLLFRRISSLDPACGSGIFIRTLLELQCAPPDELTTDAISACFQNVSGIDRDENACQATRLSLALLHLVLVDKLPAALDIRTTEILAYLDKEPDALKGYDAIIANPPFVPTVYQDADLREKLTKFMESFAEGRIDLYLAFVRIAIDALKPGGFGLFVIPHNFLLAKNASKMRKFLVEHCWIRCLVDLKEVSVFEDVGSYVVLLIFQKRTDSATTDPKALVVKCQDSVGQALQYTLEGRRIETSVFSIYDVEQETFSSAEWHILPPVETNLKRKLDKLPKLNAFMEVREGFITGADTVFLVPNAKVPKADKAVFVPYLADREMELYGVPSKTARSFFYPFENGRRLKEHEVREMFPETWAHLVAHRPILKERSPVIKGDLEWWMPVRPRKPEHMMRSKIVTPHLVLAPRFGLDEKGRYAVSHSPFLFPTGDGAEKDMLQFFLAVLNSTPCFWHIATHSHSYQRGYARLEAATLSQTPVPDPTRIDKTIMRHVLRLVEKRVATIDRDKAQEMERELDRMVADLYKLTEKERRGIGMEE